MAAAKEPRWGIRDCLTRLIYKVSSQKLISFVFATAAIVIVLLLGRAHAALTEKTLNTAILAVKDIALGLLAVRGLQSVATTLKGNAYAPRPKAGPGEEGEK